MKATVIEFKENLTGVAARMTEIEGRAKAQILRSEEPRVTFESKMET